MAAFNEGGELYSALTYLYGNGYTSTDGKNFVITATSKGFFDATRTCAKSGEVSSEINVNCVPDAPNYNTTTACTLCEFIRDTLLTERNDLEKEAVSKSNGKYVAQQLSSSVDWDNPDNPAEDVCKYMCAACAITGTEQQQRLFLAEDCDIFGGTFVTSMRSSVEASVKAIVNKHVKEIQSINSGLDLDQASVQLVDTMMAVFQASYNVSCREAVTNFQELLIEPSQSLVVSKTSQSFTALVTTSIIARLYVNETIYNTADIQSQLKVYSENSDGLEDLRSVVDDTINGINELWGTLEGKIIIIIGVIFAIVVVALAAYFYLKGRQT